MFSLIMRDIRIVSYMNLFIPIAAIVSGYIGVSLDNPIKSNLAYLLGTIISVYFTIIMLTTKEAKTRANALIVSLPIKRFDVVKSRYVSMLIYIIFASIIVYISSHTSKIIFDDVYGSPLALNAILIISSIIIMYLVFNLPFQYYNLGKAQIFNSIFYVVVILSPNIFNRLNINIAESTLMKNILELDLNQFSLILFGISILLYFISLFVSKSIYEAKEF